MTIQTIRIDTEQPTIPPTVRFSRSPLGSLWQYFGIGMDESEGTRAERDLNRIVERAAVQLSDKVSTRSVRVELIIDPLIPPLAMEAVRLLPIIAALADNASASVEPGPGMVRLRTWWEGDRVGVDAIGVDGRIPEDIKISLWRPGFSTRCADWDTGFGLADAYLAAQTLSSSIELMEFDQGVGFRLSLPLWRSSPASPPEKLLGLLDSSSSGISAAPSAPAAPTPNQQRPLVCEA